MSNKKPQFDICGRLKSARKALALTQSAFAAPIGIKQSHISGLEKGEREPSETLIILMEYHYGINRRWLCDGEGSMFLTRQSMETDAPDPPDLVTQKINQMLADMPEDKRRDVLKYAEEQKLLAEFLADKRGKKQGGAA